MFNGCSSLTKLNLSSFRTNNANEMNYMFTNCPSLRVLNLSNFNTNNLKYLRHIFENSSTEFELIGDIDSFRKK